MLFLSIIKASLVSYPKKKNKNLDTNEGHKFMRKLQFVKSKLKEWNKKSFMVLKERKKSILTDIASINAIEQGGNMSPELSVKRALRKGEWKELLLRKEVHWRQKARVMWVKEGDCNSKFFHRVANDSRNRMYIKILENGGALLDNNDSISEEILHFLKKKKKYLCTSPLAKSWRLEGLDWSPISAGSASWLELPITEKEICKAIFQLDRDKAPRPNGFTIAMFQECCNVIKEDLARVFS